MKEYGTFPFDNEHEGDVEGCCVVFRRSALEDFAAGRKTAAEVIPHSVITSAHEEFNNADRQKRLPEDSHARSYVNSWWSTWRREAMPPT